jgi:hypothetical protein
MKNIPTPILNKKTDISLEYKVKYIKKNLKLTQHPCGGSYTKKQVDKMVFLINNHWKDVGFHWYDWINTVYLDIMEFNKKNKINH